MWKDYEADSITLDQLMDEFREAKDRNFFGAITIKMKAGHIMPVIDFKKSKKIKPNNGRNND
jgi:hypothetical protein